MYKCDGRKRHIHIACPMTYLNVSSCTQSGQKAISGCSTLHTTAVSTICACNICDVIVHPNVYKVGTSSNTYDDNSDSDGDSHTRGDRKMGSVELFAMAESH